MTTRNNYDKSSTGTDIECVCDYDAFLAQWLWKENFKSLEGFGVYNMKDAWVSET